MGDQHSYTIEEQADGKFRARIVGGYLKTIEDCPTRHDAVNAALHAISRNKEYHEQGVTND
jgi:hypothetical protein